MVYDLVEVIPQYKDGSASFYQFLNSELLPILSDCPEQHGMPISSLYLKLTIDSQANVVDVNFLKSALCDDCKTRMREKLLAMEGWTAGIIDGERVCTRIVIPIKCIKWAK